MMDRRGFIGSVLALAAAPAIVRADSLMKIVPMNRFILWGDGVHDDAAALQALFDGKPVIRTDGAFFDRRSDGSIFLDGGVYALGSTIILAPGVQHAILRCNFKTTKNHKGYLFEQKTTRIRN